ncbi:MAG: NUDIX hydrolase [Clostridia bacterium]|nr:NUDIX hydrolase [Clostridia bacterium]
MNDYIPSPEESEYLKSYDPGAWPRPSVTADLMVFAGRKEKKLLMVRRGGFPYRGWWALPGGFCEKEEPPEKTAERELAEETGVRVEKFSLLGVFGGKDRDPRGWTVTCAFLALTEDEPDVCASDDAADAAWFSVSAAKTEDGLWDIRLVSEKAEISALVSENEKFPALAETGLEIVKRNGIAFDHAKIIAAAILRLKREKVV